MFQNGTCLGYGKSLFGEIVAWFPVLSPKHIQTVAATNRCYAKTFFDILTQVIQKVSLFPIPIGIYQSRPYALNQIKPGSCG